MIAGKTVLVVTGHHPAWGGATRVGDWIARSRGCALECVALGDVPGTVPTHRAGGATLSFSVDAVVAAAAERSAIFMVLGADLLDGHAENGPARDAAFAIAMRSPIPVWIVPPRVTQLPHRVLLGMDFSRASIRAARLAVGIAGSAAQVDVAHVTPEPVPRRGVDTPGPSVPELVMLFDALDAALAPLSERVFGRTLLRGEPGPALLECAAARGCDMIAVGSHGRYQRSPATALGRVARHILSAVADGRAQCSVLLSGVLTGASER
jgi:nucleotide-binding universal stress UspA family protein